MSNAWAELVVGSWPFVSDWQMLGCCHFEVAGNYDQILADHF